jgi:Spy/CpxP family protein refolding chaperone
MKRGWYFLLLLVLGAGLGGGLHGALRPVRTADQRRLDWLAAQLDLTPEQRQKVAHLHKKFCPEIYRHGKDGRPDNAEARRQCRAITTKLVRGVLAVLTPEQQKRYRTLVAPCLDESAGPLPRP